MGCWNGTCGLSQLPIMNHDPVAVMFIAKIPYLETGGADFCGAIGKWEPISFPFYASYNDYGSFENPITNIYFDKSFEHICRSVIENDAVSKDNLTPELVGEHIHENIFHINSGITLPAERSVPVGRFMMHKELFDIASSKYQQTIFNHLIKRRDELTDKIIDIHNGKIQNIFLVQALSNVWHTFGYLEYPVITMMPSDAKFVPDDIVNELAKMMSLNTFMDSIRRAYQPQQGAGSQTDGFEEHLLVADFTKTYIDYCNKKYEDDDDE